MTRWVVMAGVVVSFAGACTDAGTVEPRVAGAFGARPTISFPDGAPPAELRVAEPATGHGPPLEPVGVAVVQYTAHLWDGRQNRLVASTFNRGTPAALPLGALSPGLDAALRGRRTGSRVTAAIPLPSGSTALPALGAGEEGASSAGGGTGSTGGSSAVGAAQRQGGAGRADLFYVVDILGAHGGEDVVEAGAGAVGGVRVGAGSPPALEIPAGTPPGFAAEVLARGDGPPVEAGRLVVVQYAGATWSDRRVFTSTWERGRPEAVTAGDGSVIGGWVRALTGVPAGSRVAMVVPAPDGYGATGHRGLGIGPDETLVYVVDVLAVY